LAILPVNGSAIVLLQPDNGEEMQRFQLEGENTAVRTSLA
jgi:hypothetical protein